ncbi:MAG: DUF177 domain-containing protein [Chloroflexi bacterium]|nr:DUF177 domain-containing protein [Chloroflexota bacterium]MYF23154.1 DUF177 domain-containing protein [Chloroflexota bacterium]
MTAESGIAGHAVRRTTSLLINVSTLLQEPIGSLRRYEVVDARANGLESGISGSLRLLRTDQSVLVTASLSTTTRDLCGGCLQELELPIDLAFDEEFWPALDAALGVAVEPPPERAGFDVNGGQIDLSEAVRQYLEMGRPMSPRCGAACPGLIDREPQEAPIDERWSALANFKIESEPD